MTKSLFTRLIALLWLLVFVFSVQSAKAQVVISQIYGGGGNTGATFRNDFVELFNRGTTPVSVAGWSVQYAAATGTSWAPTSLTGTIPAGGYYLIQMAAGTGGTTNLPTPDILGNTAMSGTAGKVALVNITTAQSGSCPSGTQIVDFVGFGTTANCFEGTGPTPAPSNTNAVLRAGNGCTDAGQNATDFAAGTPTPRNSSTTLNPCIVPPTLTANPASLTGANGLTYVAGSGPASAPVSVSGANLNTASGTVTAASSSTAFTVSPPSAAFSGSALAATNFTVQLVAGLAAGPYAATITFAGGGATALVPVSGTVTVVNAPPSLSINDVSLAEGNSGTQNMVFTVTLSTTAPSGGVTFDISTTAINATAGTDYVTNSLTNQTIPSGQSSYTFAVTINGDTDSEPNESFSVVVSNVVGANVSDGVGLGTITNDDAAPATLIHTIQGITHISPLNGQVVNNVPGIVTALRSNGFYVQDPNPDADERTSEGIFVFTNTAPTVTIGMSVAVAGTVAEFRSGGSGGSNNLTTTQINSPTITVTSSGNPLPAAILLGAGGRAIPTQIIEDQSGDLESGLLTFDPATDGADFYESLEGMLVALNNPVTVSPTLDARSIWVVTDNGTNATGRNARGGITISASDFNPERILIYTGGNGTFPAFSLAGLQVSTPVSSLTGIVDYFGGDYEVLPTSTLSLTASSLTREVSTLVPTTNQLTVATFNVRNLDPGDGATQFNNLAARIVTNLRSPDIINLEEIQDNNGATNNGVVDASTTYQTLINAISAAGGPTYQYRQIDPVSNQDGGEPGGNIRVAFFYNPTRVTFVDRVGGTSTAAVSVSNVGGKPQLSFSPGRIDPTNAVFNSSRKPLVGEFLFNGQTIFVIANHFNSKGGDQDLFGKTQPPVLSSETQRNQQATLVRSFVSSILAINPNANIVVAGDLNDFQFSNPLAILKGSGATALTALIETLPANERYTYNFGGNSQAIDHVMVSQGLFSQLDAYDGVHINSEFFDQDSDHDPSIARFTLLPPPLSASVVAGSSTVCTGSPLALTVSVANFGASYSYTLTNGTNSATATAQTSTSFVAAITPTVPGAFTLTVRTVGGTTTAVVSGNVALAMVPGITTLTNNGPRCSGQTLTLSATATGGTGSLSYVWSGPGGFTAVTTVGTLSRSSATSTATGLYSLTVLDAIGCASTPASGSAVVRPNPTIVLTPNNTSVTICSGAPLTYTATVSNLTSTPTYRWDYSGLSGSFTTITGETVNTFTPDYIGSFRYRVRVTDDATGCFTDSPNRTVTINALPTQTLTASGTVNCATPSITLTAGGNGTSFTFSTGATQIGATNQAVVIAGGIYSITAINASGCINSTTVSVDEDKTVPFANLAVNGQINCRSSFAPLTATGGVSYVFSGPGGFNVSNTTGSILVNATGNYVVLVTGANGCTASVGATVTSDFTQPTLLPFVSGSLTCANTSVTLVAGGTGDSFRFSAGATQIGGNTNRAIVTAPGDYTITAGLSNGCTTSAVVTVVESRTAPAASLVVSSSLTCANASATLTASGGSTYRFSGNGVSQNGSSNTLIVTQAGTYSVLVTGTNGCTAIASATVTADASVPTASLLSSGTITCANGSATLTASGGVAYAFSGNGLSQTGSSNTAVVSQVGTYSVVVTGANGCTASATATVTSDNSTPTVSLLANNNVGSVSICAGQSLVVRAEATGGSSLTFSSRGPNGFNQSGIISPGIPSISNPMADVSYTGLYSVTVTNANGCSSSASVSLTVNALPTATINANTIAESVCQGTPVSFTGSANGIQGTVNYEWQQKATLVGQLFVPTGVTSPVFNPTAIGDITYRLQVTDRATGCVGFSTPRRLLISTNPTASLIASGTLTCANPSVLLTASGGTSYTLSDSQTNTSGNFTVGQTGLYSVTVANGNGCTASASATVTGDANVPTASLIASGTITCANTSATLTASGGTSYVLSNGARNTTGVFVVNTAGAYSVTVLAGNGCTATASAIVMSNTAIPGLSLNGNSTVCQGQSVMLTATGTGNLRWNTGETTSVISVSTTGSYSVTLTGGNGCVASASQLVTVLSCTTSTPPSSTTSTPTPTACGSPTNTMGQPLVITGVDNVSCATGTFRILTTGGNGQPINFAGVIGLSSFDPYNCVRMVDGPDLVRAINNPTSDIQPFRVRGVQVGGSISNTFAFDFKQFCTSTPPSSTTSTPPSSTTSSPTPTGCGSPTTTIGQAFVVTGVTDVSCTTGSFRILTTGGNGQPINFAGIVGLSSVDPYNCVRKVDGPDLVMAVNNPNSTVMPFSVRGVQVGGSTSNTFSFDFKAYCTSTTPPSSTTSTPPSSTTACGSPANTIGQTLRVTAVADINCATGSFKILTEGGNGQAISYANIIGLSNDNPANCVRRIDNPDQLRAVNNPNSDIGPFMLRVAQGTTQSASYSFNFKQACTGVARTATESMGELEVTVLGNPTLGETIEVVVGNTASERIDLRVSDAKGQSMSRLTIESAEGEVRQRVVLGSSAGLYLLQVSTPTRTKTVKVVRQ